MYLRAVIWLAVKMVVGSYANVLKWSHDYKVFFASWPTRGDDWRVIEAWSAEGYGWGITGCLVCLNNLDSWRTSLYGLWSVFWYLRTYRATDFTLSKICDMAAKILSHFSTAIFTTKRFVRVESCGYFASLHIYLSFSIFTYALLFISSPVS